MSIIANTAGYTPVLAFDRLPESLIDETGSAYVFVSLDVSLELGEPVKLGTFAGNPTITERFSAPPLTADFDVGAFASTVRGLITEVYGEIIFSNERVRDNIGYVGATHGIHSPYYAIEAFVRLDEGKIGPIAEGIAVFNNYYGSYQSERVVISDPIDFTVQYVLVEAAYRYWFERYPYNQSFWSSNNRLGATKLWRRLSRAPLITDWARAAPDFWQPWGRDEVSGPLSGYLHVFPPTVIPPDVAAGETEPTVVPAPILPSPFSHVSVPFPRNTDIEFNPSANMPTGLTISKIYEKIYSGTPDKIIKLRTPNEVTGRKIAFHKTTAPLLRSAWISKFSDLPNPDPFGMANSMRPRPLYLIPGRNGKAAFLVGEPGWTAPIVANDLGYRAWVSRGPIDVLERQTAWDGPDITSRDRLQWNWGEDAAIVSRPTSAIDDFSIGEESFSLWLGLSLGQGVKVLEKQTYASGRRGLHQVTFRATAQYECGWVRSDDYGTNDLSPRGGMTGTDLYSAYCGFMRNDYRTTSTQLDSPQSNTNAWRFDPTLKSAWALRAQVALETACGLLRRALRGDTDPVAELGSFYPFPLASQRIGYVVGFGNQHGPLMLEVDRFSVKDDVIDCVVAWGSIDFTGADYKRMFPVETLPENKRADAAASLAGLPDDVWFRTVLLGTGLNYPSGITYADTMIAVDVERAGASLDELLFDALEDGSPAVTYNALGAKSLVAITKGKHSVVTTVLAKDESSFVSQVKVTFMRVDGVITAIQGGYALGSGEALVAIRTGAPYEFTSPLTADEVAIGFFAVPNWTALIDVADATAAARAYLIDENQNTSDLRFNVSDDETARAIPLLLGFDRADFSQIAGSLVFGVTKPEL